MAIDEPGSWTADNDSSSVNYPALVRVHLWRTLLSTAPGSLDQVNDDLAGLFFGADMLLYRVQLALAVVDFELACLDLLGAESPDTAPTIKAVGRIVGIPEGVIVAEDPRFEIV